MSESVGIAGDQLRAIVEGIENVEEEIKELTEAKEEIYQDAKGNAGKSARAQIGGPSWP